MTYATEELQDFNKYLATLTFHSALDLHVFCKAYNDYCTTCPQEKKLEAYTKYIAVMSMFGSQLLTYLAGYIHETSSIGRGEDHSPKR